MKEPTLKVAVQGFGEKFIPATTNIPSGWKAICDRIATETELGAKLLLVIGDKTER